jgi:prepilin peptidase CpaA
MNIQMQTFGLLPAYFLVATLIIATMTDLVSHRIPNILLAPSLSIALLLSVVTQGPSGVLMALAGLAVGLAMLMPLYVMGAMGAGDVKLLGVAGAFLGPVGALIAGLATFIVGAVFGLLWIGWRMYGPSIVESVSTFVAAHNLQFGAAESLLITRKENTFAYAPAIAVGTAITLWQQGWILSNVPGLTL